MQVLILLVTWHVADLGSRPASHQSVRDIFSSICHFPRRPDAGAGMSCLQLTMQARTLLSRKVITSRYPRSAHRSPLEIFNGEGYGLCWRLAGDAGFIAVPSS